MVWIGHELTEWLEKPLEALASDTSVLELLDAEETSTLDFRELAVFGDDDHDDHDDHGDHEDHADHDDHDKHGEEEHAEHDEHSDEEHADHDDHDHEEHADADHDDHDHEEHADAEQDDHDDEKHAESGHDDHDHHDHDGADPHAWLDPENATRWLGLIAAALSDLDAENAATYQKNAETAQASLASLSGEISATLAPVKDAPYLVYHDAYQYFENRFDLSAHGAISASDARSPSAARLAELRDEVKELDIHCIFSEPQYSDKLVVALQDGTSISSAELDPLGSALTPGPDAYVQVLTNLASSVVGCLSE